MLSSLFPPAYQTDSTYTALGLGQLVTLYSNKTPNIQRTLVHYTYGITGLRKTVKYHTEENRQTG